MPRLLPIGLIAAVAAALILVEMQTRSGVLWRLVTFTYQANILAAVYYACALMSPAAERRHGLRGAVVLYVVVAGLIWNLFLVEMSMGYTPANVLLHVVVPVLALADWILVSGHRVPWWLPLAWLVYPAAYLALAVLVINNLGRRAPYYFLDVGSVGAAVFGNVAVLAACFLAAGYWLSAIGGVHVQPGQPIA